MLLQKGGRKKIDPGWILMKNQSTVDVFSNPRMVQSICHIRGRYITTHCNAVKHRVMKEATLKVYRTVWFDEGDIANIISLRIIREN